MRKDSASDGDGDKTVNSELSGGGYITADDEVELPNYLVQPPIQNDVIFEIYVE